MSTSTNSSSFYRPPVEKNIRPSHEDLFGAPSSLEQYQTKQRIEKREKKEEEERIKLARTAARGREILEETLGIPEGKYRTGNEYSLLIKEDIDSFEEAKSRADEAYMQYWYSQANGILNGWTDADYALLAEPKYETYRLTSKGGKGERRVLPKSYDRLQDIQKMIEKGPLDFSSKETHNMLIKPPETKHGHGKYQEWVDESNPLRQAVEAQANVMKDYLDKEGIPIVTEFEDGNPDNIYGEGVYLNTGTAAHIDWDSDLKRMQRYMTTPDSELGTYSQVFYRPEKSSILDNVMVDIIAGITGTSAWLAAARGGDIEDIAKSVVVGQVAPNFLEDTLAGVGVDADLFGIDPNTFSEAMTEIQPTVLSGGDIDNAIGQALGGELLGSAGEILEDTVPTIDIPDAVKELGTGIKTATQPIVDAVKTASEAAENAVDVTLIQPIDKLAQALVPDDVSLDEVVPPVETVAKPEETPVEPEKTPVEPKETPVEPEDTTIVEQVAGKFGFDAETVSDILDVPTNEVTKVFEDTTDALIAGESGKDALLEGLGGSALGALGEGAENILGSIVDGAETILSPLKPVGDIVGSGVNLANSVVSAIGDTALVNAIEESGKALGGAIEEGGGAISDITSDFEDVVRETGSAIDDTLIQPVLGAVEPVIETIEETGRAIDKNVIQPTKEGIDQLVRNIPNPPNLDMEFPEFTGPDIEFPEFTAPDIDIDIDMPEVDLPSFNPNLLAGLIPTPQQPTQVEGLFDKELFKFDTEIKSTQEMLSPFMNLRRYG